MGFEYNIGADLILYIVKLTNLWLDIRGESNAIKVGSNEHQVSVTLENQEPWFITVKIFQEP